MENEEKLKWSRKFAWDRGEATLTCLDVPMVLTWRGGDPWRLFLGEEEAKDFPWIAAEDWGLAEGYAEKYR